MYDGVKNFDRQTDRQTGRQTSLDGLKGLLACVIAFVWHYQHFQPIGSPFYTILKPFYDYGYLGVEIFYMLSGFGMILGYEKRIAESEMLPLEYFGRRLKKLYPPVLLSTIVTGVLQIVYLYQNGMIFQYAYDYFNIDYFILNLIGIQTGIINRAYSFNGPLWFVSVLLVCYIIFYLLIYLNKNREELLPIFYWLIGILGIAIIYSNINNLLEGYC